MSTDSVTHDRTTTTSPSPEATPASFPFACYIPPEGTHVH